MRSSTVPGLVQEYSHVDRLKVRVRALGVPFDIPRIFEDSRSATLFLAHAQEVLLARQILQPLLLYLS